MSRFTKLTALLLVIVMMFSVLAACGEGKAPGETNPEANNPGENVGAEGPDISEHVVLTMYCIGDEGGIHAEEHLNLINEMLTEKINAEIKPVMVSWGDYKKKLPMIWASGEEYDLTFAANWTGYYTEGSKGAFMDITELAPQYAPTMYAGMEARGVVDTLKIDGKLYMIPTDVADYTNFILNYREDLRVKYGCPEIVDDETLEIYLQAIKDNEPAMQPFGTNANDVTVYQHFLNEMDWSRPIDNTNGFFVYDLKDPTKVFNVIETEEYAAYVAKMRSYYEKGFISQSVMANSDAVKDLFTAGKCATYLSNFSNANSAYMTIKSNNPDWEIGYYCSDLNSGAVELTAPANNGMAIGAFSRNPERALMFLELLYTDRELYNLFMHGIEGVTVEINEANGTKKIPDGVNADEIALKNLGMGAKYQQFELASEDDSPVIAALMEQYAACALVPELSGFVLNQDPITAELAALKAVQDEFKTVVDKGVVGEEGLANLREMMNAAGAQKILDEMNAQISEFIK